MRTPKPPLVSAADVRYFHHVRRSLANLYTSLVKFSFSNTDETLRMPRALVCGSSQVFERMLSGDMREAQTQEIYLPEDDIEIVRSFAAWLVTKILEPTETRMTARMEELARIWVFADKYQILELCDMAITRLLYVVRGKRFQIRRPFSTKRCKLPARYVFENCHRTSQLYKLMIQMIVREISKEKLEAMRNSTTWSKDVLIDISIEIHGNSSSYDLRQWINQHHDWCGYHVHAKGAQWNIRTCPWARLWDENWYR